MSEHLPEDLFARLERERLDADRLYNDALTEVDRAIRAAPLLPRAPRLFDDARVADLNGAWDILPQGAPVVDRSLKGRLRGFIWRVIGPPLGGHARDRALAVSMPFPSHNKADTSEFVWVLE